HLDGKARAVLTGERAALNFLGRLCGIATLVHQFVEKIQGRGAGFGASGKARRVLTGERAALNFLGRLCGIATLVHQFVEKIQGTRARIRDTRKTTPGLRLLEKYAVKTGGGTNHRIGLYDAILLKENHIALAGGGKTAPSQRKRAPR